MESSLESVIVEPALARSIYEAFNSFIESFCEAASTEEKKCTGGAIYVLGPDGAPILLATGGNISGAESVRFSGNAENKCKALYQFNQTVEPEEYAHSTFDSRILNPEDIPPIYGGGITVTDKAGNILFYIAFSGFPPHWDEALDIAVTRRLELLPEKAQHNIVEISGNRHIRQALELVQEYA